MQDAALKRVGEQKRNGWEDPQIGKAEGTEREKTESRDSERKKERKRQRREKRERKLASVFLLLKPLHTPDLLT